LLVDIQRFSLLREKEPFLIPMPGGIENFKAADNPVVFSPLSSTIISAIRRFITS
jgi:hypothetical protein